MYRARSSTNGLQAARARPYVTETASRVGIMNQALIELKDIGLTLPSQAGDVEILRAGLCVAAHTLRLHPGELLRRAVG